MRNCVQLVLKYSVLNTDTVSVMCSTLLSECVCVLCAYERRSFLRFLLQKVISRFCEEFVFYGTFHPICLQRLSTLSSLYFVIQKNKIIKMLPLVVNFSSSFFQKTLSNQGVNSLFKQSEPQSTLNGCCTHR